MSARRDNGTGSVYKDGNKWVAAIQIGVNSNGKPKIKKFTSVKSEAEVKKKLKEFLRNQNKFIQSENSKRTTVKEYFNHWLYECKYKELKAQSFDRLESTVNNHIIPEIGMLQFAQVTQEDVRQLISKKEKEGLSKSSLKKIIEAIKSCYKFDYNKGDDLRVCRKNSIIYLDISIKSKKDIKEIKVFTDEEIERLKEVIFSKYDNGRRKYPYGEAYLLMLNTGLRAGEVLALDRNIDFNLNQIEINKNLITTKNRDENGKITKDFNGHKKATKISSTPKTKSSFRTIKLNEKAIEYVKSLLSRPANCDNLIVNQNGNILTMQAFYRTFDKILKEAGIDTTGGVGLHALRHTFATKLFEAGVEVKVVSNILGHSSTNVTYNTYIHVLDRIKAKAMEIPNF